MQNFDVSRIDGHTLRVFLSVCDTGSVSRTAEVFELNQSTISHTLDKMRSAVGDPLFVRSGRGITPSEKALSMVPRVQKILSDIEGLVSPEKYDISLDNRPVVVAIPTPALLLEMKGLFAALAKAAPEVRFEIRRLAPRNRVNDMLALDEAELAVSVAGYKYPPTINHCYFGSDDLVVFYDPKERSAVKTVDEYSRARHAVVNFGGNVKSEVETSLSKIGLKREISLVAPTASMLGDLIRGTDLIATMPLGLAEWTYQPLAYCRPPIDLQPIVYELAWHRRYEYSGRNKWLRQLILSSRRTPETLG